eukprot:4395345-Alexandrium_andersonii.AAC.1
MPQAAEEARNRSVLPLSLTRQQGLCLMMSCKQPQHQASGLVQVAAAGTEHQHAGVVPGNLLQEVGSPLSR